MNVKTKAATAVSIVVHPFVCITLPALLVSWNLHGRNAALEAVGAVLLGAIVPLSLYILWLRSTGQWQSVDASMQTERPLLYRAVLAAMIPASLYLLYVERTGIIVRGVLAVAILMSLGAALNRWLKLSLHVAFAVFAGLVLNQLSPDYGIAFLIIVPLVAWSRLALWRHTMAEVLGGIGLGAVAATVVLW
jgi:membrane-associated phospholipid phosphatase